jgi:hypothetical protein
MKKQEYLEMKRRHEEEMNDFPIAYAFNDEQLQQALEKLGVASTKECVTVFGHGDIVKRENAKPLVDMLARHTNEIRDKLKEDVEFAEAAFLYEMDNHEYAINWSADEDVLECFCIDWDFIRKYGLQMAYDSARNKHFKHMEDWGVI